MTANACDRSAVNISKVQQGFRFILEGLGVDMEDPHLQRTPERAAKAWVGELCAAYSSDPPQITMFPHEGRSEMIVLEPIPVFSVCAHHLLPFVGTAVVGYIPGRGEICGVSKLSRLVRYYAAQLQVQERLTNQVADALWDKVGREQEFNQPLRGGVGVVIRASHHCMLLRGVRHASTTTTSALRGRFAVNDATRAEFLSLVHSYR
jgi:GTP cyclohydrolase I